jgi:signal transduction histidine kinase/CheY-like chemotaxis protein/HPt (histidine-containing phosphotransfer) domain-containing protein
MVNQRFKYLLLITFLVSIVVIVFLQYNSGNSIKSLIRDNKSLVNELRVKKKLQQLQTDIIFAESALRDLVSNENAQHIQELDKQLNVIDAEFTEIQRLVTPANESALWNRLDFLIKEKMDNTDQATHILFNHGRDSALHFIRSLRGRTIRDSIIYTIGMIDDSRQQALSNISSSANLNGAKAKSWGIILAVIACLASISTFWYFIYQGQRQQELIQTLDKSERRLKEASKIQEQFVANISHEIRTPMNAILGFAGLLQKTKLDKNQHEYVRSIRSSAENLLTIINDILDLSRIESGMMHIETLPFNLRELLDSLVTMMKVKAQNRNLYLRTESDESVPEILRGDAVRLTQILLNLISNALKFTHEGGVVVKLDLVERKEESCLVRFTICDTGIGIDPEKQKTIFDRFQQAQPETTRRYGGTGLGLSIVKQLVEIQNGAIFVASELGKGSVFTVMLPYQIAGKDESAVPAPILVAEPLIQKIKLLVAEDNAMNRKLVQHLLEHWQIDFDIVNNGAEAVQVLSTRGKEYDMVLMDIQMPEMDGYTATEKIRFDLHLNLPIIAMTAHALAGEKERCIGAGMDDYISKPIDEQLLYKLIHKYAQALSESELAVIDMDYLRLLSKGDKEFERNMMQAFTEQIPRELHELKTAISKRNYKKIASVAHTMKSTVSYLGIHQLTPLLEQIEADAHSKNGVARINDNFTSVEATCQLAIREVNKLMVFDQNQLI